MLSSSVLQKRRKRRIWFRHVLVWTISFTMVFGLIPGNAWPAIAASTAQAAEIVAENTVAFVTMGGEEESQGGEVETNAEGQGGISEDLQNLLNQPAPAWQEQQVNPQSPAAHPLNGVQVSPFLQLPDDQYKPAPGGGGNNLSVTGTSVGAFSPVGKGATSVTFSWKDSLKSWINAQPGDPVSPPSGYPVTLYVKDLKYGQEYMIRGKQTNSSGTNTFVWTGLTSAGDPVPDGIYAWYMEADSVTVKFKFPPEEEGGESKTVTKTAPGYNSQYSRIVLDREAPAIVAVHDLGGGTLGVEMRDEIGGLDKLISNVTPAEQIMSNHPLHAVAPVKPGTQGTLNITVRDFAGNETVDSVGAFPVLAHMGEQSFWPQVSEQVAGEQVTINLYSGNGHQKWEGFTQPTAGRDVEVTLAYDHQNREKGWLGYGWSLSFDSTLTRWPDGDISWIAPDGTGYWFKKTGDSYTTYVGGQQQYYPQLTRNEKLQYLITWSDQSYDLFTFDGRILQHWDRYGNLTDYKYEELYLYHRPVYRLNKVITPSGKEIEFVYNDISKRLDKIVAPGPEEGSVREMSFTYYEDGMLKDYTNVMGYVTAFTYDSLHRLETVTDPKQVVTTWSYDNNNRVQRISMTRATDGVEEFIAAQYSGNYATVSNPLGNYEVGWDVQGRPAYTKQTVPVEGGTAVAETRYQYDRNNLIKITDPMGRITQHHYDTRDRLEAYRSPSGRVMSYLYNDLNDLTRETGPYGYDVQYIPVLNGKKMTVLVRVEYVSDPFGRTAPHHVVSTKYYDAKGLLDYELDGKGQKIDYSYDEDGNLTFDGFDHAYTYDRNGNQKTMTIYPGTVDAATTQYQSNNQGQTVYTEHPNGLVEEWQYDEQELMTNHVQYDKANPTAKRETYSYAYNEGQYKVLETSETMQTVYVMDGMGNVTRREMKPVGSSEIPLVYRYIYDVRGLVLEENNPTGERIDNIYNPAGQWVKVITNPDTLTKVNEYDAFGRLSAVVSVDGGRQEYLYDLWDRQVVAKEYRSVQVPEGVPFTWKETEPQIFVSETRYNSSGQVIEEKTATGAWTRSVYDENGQLASETRGGPIPTWDGKSLMQGEVDTIYPGYEVLSTRHYEYDAQGRLVKETDGEGYVTEYLYNGRTMIKKIPAFDENGNLVTYEEKTVQDTMGNVVKKIAPSGDTENYQYDVFGKMTLSKTAEGKKTVYVYNSFEQLDYTVEDVTRKGETQRVDYSYDAWGNMDKVHEQLEGSNYAVTDYDYNSLGQLVELKEPSGLKTRYDYDDHGWMKWKKEYNKTPDGLEVRETKYAYDRAGHRYETVWPDETVSYVLHDTAGNQVVEIDQEENVILSHFDGDGRLTAFKQLGEATRSNASPKAALYLDYDGKGNLVVKEDPLGYITVLEYDKEGRLTQEKAEGSSIGGKAISKKYRYDPRGLKTRFTNGEGHTTTYTYDKEGQLLKETDPEGIWTKYEYSPDGYIMAKRRPENRNMETDYNLRGQKLWEKDALGYQYEFDYDVGGRLNWETDKKGDKIRYQYDDAGRMTKKYTPNEGTYTFDYDDAGNQVEMDKPVYGTTYYLYDERDRLVRVNEPGEDGERLITRYTHDDNGNLEIQIDPNGQKTQFAYDYANRKSDEIMYLNGVSYTFKFRYDAAGNLDYEEKPGGQWTDYDYDLMHRLVYEKYSDGRWVSYTYYDDNTVKTETTSDGTTHYTYYDNGQIKTVSFPNGDEVAYEYDDNGDLHKEIVNGQPRIYDRDDRGMTSTYTDAKGYIYEYFYDPDGYVKDLKMPNGVVTQYEYNPGHLIDTKKTTGPGENQIYFNDYEHNKRDFVIAVDENGRSFAFDYESREQLERVTTPEGDIRLYTYDGAGNRKTRSAIIGGKELDRGETIELEEFLQMILTAIKGQEEAEIEEEGEGKAKGHEKGNRGKGKGDKKSSYEEQHDLGVGEVKAAANGSADNITQSEEGNTLTTSDADPQSLAYQGSDLSLYAAKGGNGKGKSGTDKGKGNENAKGKPDETGWKNALQRGNGKKWGLYKKLGLVDGPFEHITGQMENILAVIDNIVNGEVNLPPGEHEELFKLVREVGKGYTILGTTWDYNERNAITHKTNEIRLEEYDFGHDDSGNMTTDGRSVYQWNAKGQLEKVTFPDGFGQKYEYDAKGRRTKTIQFNHQGSIQWVVNYHYKGNTWQITHETDQDDNIIMEYTYDEKSKPLSVTYKGETFWYVYNGHGDVVALTDKNGEIAARYEYDEWGVVTRMYNRFGERVREGIGWIGDLNTGNGTPGSRLGPSDDNEDYDFHPGNGRGKAKGWEKNNKGQKGSGDEETSVQSIDEVSLQESVDLNMEETASGEQSVTSDVYEAGTLSGDDEEVTEDITTELVKENPFRYAGYYWDRKTQFYYLQARYYNPRLGRFLSLDPWRGEVTSPLSLNRYVYSLNNPVNYWDPTGNIAFVIPLIGVVVIEASKLVATVVAGITVGLSISKLKNESKTKRILFHYTTEYGLRGILTSGRMYPSLREKRDAFSGDGQYFTDVAPGTVTKDQLSYTLFRNYNTWRISHFLAIDVSGLYIKPGNREHIFLHPTRYSLDIRKRIVSAGKTP